MEKTCLESHSKKGQNRAQAPTLSLLQTEKPRDASRPVHLHECKATQLRFLGLLLSFLLPLPCLLT